MVGRAEVELRTSAAKFSQQSTGGAGEELAPFFFVANTSLILYTLILVHHSDCPYPLRIEVCGSSQWLIALGFTLKTVDLSAG